MLTRIYIDNYRCFTNFEWKPGKLVLIAGRNGSGQSTLLSALDDIQFVLASCEVDKCLTDDDLTRWDTRPRQLFEIDARIAGEDYRYRLVVDRDATSGKARIQEESLRTRAGSAALFEFAGGEVRLFTADGQISARFPADGARSPLTIVPWNDHDLIARFMFALTLDCYLLAPLPPALAAESTDEHLGLHRNAEDFVGWYRKRSGDSVRVGQLNQMLAKALDGFVGLRLIDSGRKAKLLQAVFASDTGSARSRIETTYDFDELSDGQRALILLYALLAFGAADRGTLCIDEPTNFVSLAEIEPWLRELEDRIERGDGQAFLISHNPEVINRLWQGHGVIFERDWNGPVRVRAMDESFGLPPAEVIARGAE